MPARPRRDRGREAARPAQRGDLAGDPHSDLEELATALDVWRDLLIMDVTREVARERVLAGRAWGEAEVAMRWILDALQPRAIVPNERAEKVLRLAREHLAWLESQHGSATERALGDLDELRGSSGDMLPALLDLRARALARKGRPVEAIAASTELLQRDDVTAQQRYNAACVFGRCAGAIRPADAGGLTPEQEGTRTRYASEAMLHLKAALAAGFDDVDAVRGSSDLAVLRGRPEFDAVVRRASR